jgi:wyosine [tRNA(Phe)-imidazoG37] synthetase (radical SAM superfamily)
LLTPDPLQFPDRIKQLNPVTQLYVSVDASNPEALKAVDRWEWLHTSSMCLEP